jgi:hypothetical protein
MKHTTVVTGVLAVMLMFGSALAGWSLDGDEDSGGILTLTDIPAEYNGKYAVFYDIFDDDTIILGAKEIDGETGVFQLAAITEGSVDILLWLVTDEGDGITVDRYAGNETLNVDIMIYDDEAMNLSDVPAPLFWADFDAVGFIENHATRSWNDADISR